MRGSAEMPKLIRTGDGELTVDNRLLLAYLRHTARTAQPAAPRRLFAIFAKQEQRAMETIDTKRYPIRVP